MSTRRRAVIQAGLSLLLLGGLYAGLTVGWGGLPPIERFVDPAHGLWHTARTAPAPQGLSAKVLPELRDSVTVVRDERGVPHIYAQSDRDAVMAMGYVVAQDRLFQMDFVSRVAQGRLSDLLGPDMADNDRFLRATGMEWGAQQNIARIQAAQGTEWDALRWYSTGANAHIDALQAHEWPLPYRVLDASPRPRMPVDGIRLLQYMTYDLTYRSDAPVYDMLQARLDTSQYAALYPDHPPGQYAPVYPEGPAESTHRTAFSEEPVSASRAATSHRTASRRTASRVAKDTAATDAATQRHAQSILQAHHATHQALQGSVLEGYRFGKGSNNWAVAPERSATGGALLANDMHLGLSLPSIWYEVHLHTPTTDVSGLTLPGAPVIVQGVNNHVAWGLTNAGADVVDHYALTVNDDRTQYRHNGRWRDLQMQVDTLYMQDGAPVLDTLRISHWGPLLNETPPSVPDSQAVALQWVAHHENTTLHALWKMNRATSVRELDDALADWTAPMQNIAMADTEGSIGMRTAGRMPMRAAASSAGLLPGNTDAHAWTGWVPHREMPHVINPERGVVGSANQVPVEASYPHYVGHNWRDGYRSVRLDTLLQRAEEHSLNDMKAYQADVYVQERSAFAPFIAAADTTALTERGRQVQRWLLDWPGHATTDRFEPLVLRTWLRTLRSMVWDEEVFANVPRPEDAVLLRDLEAAPTSPWFDRTKTESVETGPDVLRDALNATADTLAKRYGWDPDAWTWGEHHQLEIDFLLPAGPFEALGRGPYPFPGFTSTLLQAPGLRVTHTASQRAVVDLSGQRPEAHVVYPGGQREHPFDPTHYDLFVDPYMEDAYYVQARPTSPNEIEAHRVTSRLQLHP